MFRRGRGRERVGIHASRDSASADDTKRQVCGTNTKWEQWPLLVGVLLLGLVLGVVLAWLRFRAEVALMRHELEQIRVEWPWRR